MTGRRAGPACHTSSVHPRYDVSPASLPLLSYLYPTSIPPLTHRLRRTRITVFVCRHVPHRVGLECTSSGLSRLPPSAPSTPGLSLHCPAISVLVFLLFSSQGLAIPRLFSVSGRTLFSVRGYTSEAGHLPMCLLFRQLPLDVALLRLFHVPVIYSLFVIVD